MSDSIIKLISKTDLAPKDGFILRFGSDGANLSKEVCRKFIDKRLVEAGAEGQFVIEKPSKAHNKTLPFAVNNCDGEGTFFNDYLFE